LEAHSLKGAAAYLCATALRDVACQLELAAKEKNDQAYPPLLEKLHYEHERVKRALLAFVPGNMIEQISRS
jgi:HPt (histidine-containing phosphotransfer) domain-containing protein